MLKQYIRDKKNNPIGILLAKNNNDGLIRVGWSLCSKKDKFNKEKGMMIAKGRLESYFLPLDYTSTKIELNHPHSIQKDIDYIIDRAKRYYNKTAKTE